MPVLDLSAYKPVPGTLEDANQIANGFQAVQNCINALDNNNFAAGKIFDPLKLMQDGAAAGQGLIWSAAANGGTGGWVPGAAGGLGGAVTVSTMAGGPPGSPADKDVWVATAVDANGLRWIFQYNAGSASAFKWEFLGGMPLIAATTASEGISAPGIGTFVEAATTSRVTAPRAGDYNIAIEARVQTSTPGASGQWVTELAYQINAAAVTAQATSYLQMTTADTRADMHKWEWKETLAINDVLKLVYSGNIAAQNITNRRIALTPVRVS